MMMADDVPWPELPVQERLARKFRMEAEREDPVTYVPPVVLESAPIEVDELPKPIRDIAVKLSNVLAFHSRTFIQGTPFKTGPKQGQMRPDKEIDHYSIGHRGSYPLMAVWSDGKLQFARGYRKAQWYYTDKVTELKNWLKEDGGWE